MLFSFITGTLITNLCLAPFKLLWYILSSTVLLIYYTIYYIIYSIYLAIYYLLFCIYSLVYYCGYPVFRLVYLFLYLMSISADFIIFILRSPISWLTICVLFYIVYKFRPDWFMKLRESKFANSAFRTVRYYCRFPRQESVPDQLLCVICVDNPKMMMVQGCGHVCLCNRCADVISQGPIAQRRCPMCQGAIAGLTRVYI